ncbi:UNVERIFIED_CONTAM: hypothetical protein Slati_1480700 [Sesamum latifolium]|uniref:Uncharacterized protein n=1 Tax=Sesamum latifolium TaxID=2727402 RepID=A0AAW2X665_9LAMI
MGKEGVGVSIIEHDSDAVHGVKRRVQLIDEDSDSISTETAGRHETSSVELSGVGPPLDSSHFNGVDQASSPYLGFSLRNQV